MEFKNFVEFDKSFAKRKHNFFQFILFIDEMNKNLIFINENVFPSIIYFISLKNEVKEWNFFLC